MIKNPKTSEYIKNKNEKYTILSIRGLIVYYQDFDGCIRKRDKVAKELFKLFPNSQKTQYNFEHSVDPSGDSIIDAIYFEFDSGDQGEVSCYDFEETLRIKNNWSDNLSVAIDSKEIVNWLESN